MIKSRLSAIRYLRTHKPKFAILIGSTARRSQKRHSDIDIVRIVYHEPVTPDLDKSKDSEISYIDFDSDKFSKLYRDGSLFLHHVFTEGVLLRGNRNDWNGLKEYFRVSTNFRREISQNRKLLEWLQRGEKFRGATIPYLAHTFRALKNLAIFLLAHKQEYVFEKRAALQKAFPTLDTKAITVLINANNIFERSSDVRPNYIIEPNTIAHVRREIANAVHGPRACR